VSSASTATAAISRLSNRRVLRGAVECADHVPAGPVELPCDPLELGICACMLWNVWDEEQGSATLGRPASGYQLR
jgi:hypothetical protein